MSLLKDIEKFHKQSLRSVPTEIVSLSGRRVKVDPETKETTVLNEGETGFVGDYKPDLQVGNVVPGLFLGSQDAAADFKLLQNLGITHILNVGAIVDNFFPDKFTYLKKEILDLPETDIVSHFPICHQFIDAAIKNGGKVFVHCNAGVSRAATLCIGYVMSLNKMDFSSAYELVKEKRSCIRPNDGFIRQLKQYEAIVLKK